MISREFNLYLHAGHSIPLVINVNQYDRGEQWLFTLFNADGTQYVPSSGAIVGIKSDNLGIINTATVDSQGRVVVAETQQMTAAVGKAVFELVIDDGTHGTANFVVLVEPKPGDNADLSETDISMIEQAIEAASTIKPYGSPLVASTVAGMTDHDKVYVYVGSETGYTSGNWYYWDGDSWESGGVYNSVAVQTDTTLALSGVAADSKKVGDEISDLKSQISTNTGIPYAVKLALDTILQNVGFKNTDVYTDELATIHAWATDVNLVYISAVFTQGANTVYNTDSLDYLKQFLVVTANYDNGTSVEVDSYELSGELTVGTSAITVTYLNKTTAFNVTVTKRTSFIYAPTDGILSEQRYISLREGSSEHNLTESIINGQYVARTSGDDWFSHYFNFAPATFTTAAKLKITFTINSTAYLASGNTSSLGYIAFIVSDGTYCSAIGFPRYANASGNIRPRYATSSSPSWAGSGFAFAVNTTHTAEIIVANNKQTVKLDDVDIITDQPLAEYSLGTASRFWVANSNSASSAQKVTIDRLEYYIDEGVE